MECISSVRYLVLISGSQHGSIIPQRGLRQGDPITLLISDLFGGPNSAN